MGRFDQYWEMRKGGPYDKNPAEIFKCTKCNAETEPERGFNGDPSTHRCHHDCRMEHSDLRSVANDNYRKGYERMFPNAPGAGI